MNCKKLFDNYYLKTDPRNFILYKKVRTKGGNIEYRKLGYYTTMGKLIRGLKEIYTIDNIEDYMNNMNFDGLIKKLNEIDKIIKG